MQGFTVTTITSADMPWSVAVANGYIYYTEYGAGTVKAFRLSDGATDVVSSGLKAPTGIDVDNAGNIIVAECGNQSVKRVRIADGAVLNAWGGIACPRHARTNFLTGDIIVGEMDMNLVRRINTRDGSMTTIYIGRGGPCGTAVDSQGNVYVGEYFLGSLYRMTATQEDERLLVGVLGVHHVTGIAVDGSGNVYAVRDDRTFVTRIDPYSGTSSVLEAGCSGPRGIYVDPEEGKNIYVACTDGGVIKRISVTY